MSVSGSLSATEFAHLLRALARERKTGVLHVSNGTVEKRVFFSKGKVAASASTDPSEYLGAFLVGHGFISEEQLEKAMEIQQTSSVMLGKILTTIEAISPQDLENTLRLKFEESVYEIFRWSEGDFRFEEGEQLERAVPLSLEVSEIVMEAAKRQEEEQSRARQQPLPSKQSVAVAVQPLNDPRLSAQERKILALVNDQRSLEEIQKESGVTESLVMTVLCNRVAEGKIKMVQPRKVKVADSSAQPSTETSARTLLRGAGQHLKAGNYELALRHLNAAAELEPNNDKVLAQKRKGEEQIQQRLEKSGIVPQAVPILSRPVEELTSLQLSRGEAFLLSRIDGKYDIESILKVSPVPRLQNLLSIYKLVAAGHLTLSQPGG